MIDPLVALACAAVALVTVLAFGTDWRLELMSHFRPHLAVVAAALAVVAWATDFSPGSRLGLSLVVLAAAAVNLREIVRAIPKAGPVEQGDRLRIAFANVLKSNTDHRRVIDWVRREKVDVFVAAETVRGWPAALDVLRDELPFVAALPPGDVTIFSRRPMVGEPRYVSTANSHLAAADLGGVTVVGTHTASPETRARSVDRDAMIATVGEVVRGCAGPVVVVGDFNAAPWSGAILKLIADTGLCYGPGAHRGTFPAQLRRLRLPGWTGIPIDLVLVRDARVVAWGRGPRIGSDHWPVLAEVALEKRPPNRHFRRLDPPDPRP